MSGWPKMKRFVANQLQCGVFPALMLPALSLGYGA